MEVIKNKYTLLLMFNALTLSFTSGMAFSEELSTGFFASTDTSLSYSDNIYRVTDDLATTDYYFSLAPDISLIGGLGKHRFKLRYTGDYAKFSEQSSADFTDHDVQAEIILDHTSRLSTNFRFNYQKDHEEPGYNNLVQLNLSEYNKFNYKSFRTGIQYGTQSSIARINFDYQKDSNDYTNNALDFLDYSSDLYRLRLSYNLSSKTNIYIQGSTSSLDYDDAANVELDNDFKNYRIGTSWNFSNKLTGDVNIGYQERDYEQPLLQDISGLAYDGSIIWAINTYTSLKVNATRQSIDSSIQEAGGFLRTTLSTALKHELTETLTLESDLRYSKDELVTNLSRVDDRYGFGVALDYDLSRLISLKTEYIYEERSSTQSFADFKSNILSISLSISLDE